MSEKDTDQSECLSNACLSPESDQDGVVVIGAAITTPYKDKQILHSENTEETDEEVDIDGILLHELKSRFEKEIL